MAMLKNWHEKNQRNRHKYKLFICHQCISYFDKKKPYYLLSLFSCWCSRRFNLLAAAVVIRFAFLLINHAVALVLPSW